MLEAGGDNDDARAMIGRFSQGQQKTVVVATQTVAFLSFVGSIIIVFANFRFKQLRTYSFQLVVWLAVCDICVDVSFFLGSPSDGSTLCYTQAIVLQFFQMAFIQWAVLMSQSLLVVASKTGTFDGRKRMLWNHIWAWGVSAILTLGPSATNSYGESETAFCWIQTRDSWDMGSVWRLAFVVVCALSIVFVVWTHVAVVRYLDRAQRGVFLLASHPHNNSSSIFSSSQSHSSGAALFQTLVTRKIVVDDTRMTPTANLGSSANVISSARAANVMSIALSGHRARLEHPQGPGSRRTSVVADEEVAAVAVGINGTAEGGGLEPKKVESPIAARAAFLSRCASSVSAHGGVGSLVDAPTEITEGKFTEEDAPNYPRRRTSVASSNRSVGSSQVNTKNWLWSASNVGIFAEDRASFITDNDDFLADEPIDKSLPAVYGATNQALPAPMSMSVWRHDVRPIEGRAQDRTTWMNPPETSLARNLTSSSIAPPSLQMVKSAIDFKTRCESIAVIGNKGNPIIARTHPRPIGLNVGDGTGGMRNWVHSMSSFDADPVIPSQSESNSNTSVEASGGSSIRVAGSGPETSTGHHRCNSEPPSGRSDVIVTSVISHVSRAGGRRKRAGAADMRKFVARVKWYPVIFALCWVFTIINGVEIIVVGQHNAIWALALLAMVTARLQGLLNFLYYGLNGRLKQAWLQDLLYRRAAASGCWALCCCCSCTRPPCCHSSSDYGTDKRGNDTTAGVDSRSHALLPIINNNNNNPYDASEENTTDTALRPSTTNVANATTLRPETQELNASKTDGVQVIAMLEQGECWEAHHGKSAVAMETAITPSSLPRQQLSYTKQKSRTLFTTPKPDQFCEPRTSRLSTPPRPTRPARGSCYLEVSTSKATPRPPALAAAGREAARGNNAKRWANRRTNYHSPTRFKFNTPDLNAAREHEKSSRHKTKSEAASTSKRRGEKGENNEKRENDEPQQEKARKRAGRSRNNINAHVTKTVVKLVTINNSRDGEQTGEQHGLTSGRQGGDEIRGGGAGSNREVEGTKQGLERGDWDGSNAAPRFRVISPKFAPEPVVVSSVARTRHRVPVSVSIDSSYPIATAAAASGRSCRKERGLVMTARELFQQGSRSSEVISSGKEDNGEGVGRDRYGSDEGDSGYGAGESGRETEVERCEKETMEGARIALEGDEESLSSFNSSNNSDRYDDHTLGGMADDSFAGASGEGIDHTRTVRMMDG